MNKSFIEVSGTRKDFPYVYRHDTSLKQLHVLNKNGWDFKRQAHYLSTFKGNVNGHIVAVSQFEDEWFFVTIVKNFPTMRIEKYYKCDQIEGVVDCLKSICL